VTARARCATCDQDLGELHQSGWLCMPARQMMRQRLVAEVPTVTEANALTAPPGNWRTRSVVRSLRFSKVRVFEQPYTCDSDACMNALGPEWVGMNTRKLFVRHPFDTSVEKTNND